MPQPTDFQALRARRKRGIFLRRFLKGMLILAFIALASYTVLNFGNVLVQSQFPTRVVNFVQGLSGPGFPARAPGGVLRDVKSLGTDVAILSDSSLHLYNRSGRQLLGVQRISDTSVLLTNDNRILIYAIGSPHFSLYFQNRLILEGEHDNPIISAALGARGNYALVSSTMQFRSQVRVFNEQFEQYFEWSSPTELVAMVALNPRGTAMAAASIGAQGGEIVSTIFLFAFHTQEMGARRDFPGELVLALEYLDDTAIAIVTDAGLRILDGVNGAITGRYDIPGGRLSLSRIQGGHILLLNENPEYHTRSVILLDASGDVLARYDSGLPIRDMQVGPRNIYLLTAKGVTRYDHQFSTLAEVSAPGVLRILIAGNNLYYFTYQEIRVMDFYTTQNGDD